jgi:SdpC family antimicrobial peptide
MKIRNKLLAASVAVVVAFAGGTGTAMASDRVSFFAGEANSTAIQDQYTDAEILEILFNGTGPVADENPALLERLNFSEDHEKADPALLAEVIDAYLGHYPNVEADVFDPLTSGDPELVESALSTLTTTYLDFLKTEYGTDVSVDSARAGCWAGAEVCVIAYGVAFVNVAVYANAALATLAVFALAVVPAAVSYLMDEDSGESVLVKDELVAELTRTLAFK